MRTPAVAPLPSSLSRRAFLRALCAALATAFTPLAADLRRLTCWRAGLTDPRLAGAG